jgi:hypothetical protein
MNSKYNVLTASNTVEISFASCPTRRARCEFTTVVAFDTEERAIPPGHCVGRLMADTVRDEMVDFVKIEALKPEAMSITILWLPVTFDGPLVRLEILLRRNLSPVMSPQRRFQRFHDSNDTDFKTFRNDMEEPGTLWYLLKRRVSVSMLCFDCRLHDIAEQKFLYPVWSLGMVVEGIV